MKNMTKSIRVRYIGRTYDCKLRTPTWSRRRLGRIHGDGVGVGGAIAARGFGRAAARRCRLHGSFRGRRCRGRCCCCLCRSTGGSGSCDFGGLFAVGVSDRLAYLHDHLEDSQEEGLTRGFADENAHGRQLEIASSLQFRGRRYDDAVARKPATIKGAI